MLSVKFLNAFSRLCISLWSVRFLSMKWNAEATLQKRRAVHREQIFFLHARVQIKVWISLKLTFKRKRMLQIHFHLWPACKQKHIFINKHVLHSGLSFELVLVQYVNIYVPVACLYSTALMNKIRLQNMPRVYSKCIHFIFNTMQRQSNLHSRG